MSLLTFKMPYQAVPELVISPEEIMKYYLHGVPLCNVDGREMTSDFIRQKILDAQEYLENLLYIKLTEQIIKESSDFNRNEWKSWGYVKTSYQVKLPLSLEGWYNNIKQVTYPGEWLSNRKENSSLHGEDDSVFFRQIHVVPSGTTAEYSQQGIVFSGVMPHLLFIGVDYIPNFWHKYYVTGFSKVPRDLITAVGKLAAIQVLVQLGDTYMGVGTSSYSIGLDGLSQSIQMLKSNEAGIYGSRIKAFGTELWGQDGKRGIVEALKAKYKGVIWDVC